MVMQKGEPMGWGRALPHFLQGSKKEAEDVCDVCEFVDWMHVFSVDLGGRTGQVFLPKLLEVFHPGEFGPVGGAGVFLRGARGGAASADVLDEEFAEALHDFGVLGVEVGFFGGVVGEVVELEGVEHCNIFSQAEKKGSGLGFVDLFHSTLQPFQARRLKAESMKRGMSSRRQEVPQALGVSPCFPREARMASSGAKDGVVM